MIAAGELARFAHAVEARLGLRVEDERAAIAADVLARRAAAHHESVDGYLARLGALDEIETGELARELTVGESYFFRHVEQLDAFCAVALPRRAEIRGPFGKLAVLSAGCSSGEEAYTLAIKVRERAPELAPRVAIHGFDANPAAIARARAAHYSRWSLRATPPASERRWFVRDGHAYVVAPAIREAVTFAEGNLTSDGPQLAPGRWDIIFCRNALMYLTEACARDAVDRLIAALAPGGYLFLGHAESIRDRPELAICATPGAFYYQHEPASAIAVPVSSDWVAEIGAASARVHKIVDGAQRPTPPPPIVSGDAGTVATLVDVRALLAAERYGDARARLATVAGDAAHAREIALLRAVALTHAGEGDAERACAELIACDPDGSAGGHYLLAVCRDGAGDAVDARAHARRAAEIDPTFAMARVELGLLARRGGDRDEASRELTAAIASLEREDDARLALFGGGFGRRALIGLCRAELAAVQPEVAT